MDLYNILEIKPNSSEIEIKKAYFRLIKIYHPDKNNSPDANAKFQKIHSAYQILINNKTRQEYQKMNQNEKITFIEILEKIIGKQINIEEFNKFNFNLHNSDFEYIKNNFINFIRTINVQELVQLFKSGVVLKKDFTTINCSESENDIYDENIAEYYYQLPIIQNTSELDINIELQVNINDITSNKKRKIKIKRKINNQDITSTFIFNLTHPFIIFMDAGDSNNGNCGNLIIKLNLPNNFYWNDNIILIEYPMTLYQMIYGLDIYLELGYDDNINIQNWVPSRDGFLIDINNQDDKTNNIIQNIAIKLYLNYENSLEKEQLLKQFFHK